MPVIKPEEYFVRRLDLETLDISINLHQKLEGDVGCVVWDASIVLAKYLEKLYNENQKYFKKLHVLELGSGVGCVGLTAACLGANVLLTDLAEILPILEKNVEENRDKLKLNNGEVRTRALPWGEDVGDLKPNLVLFADCIYYRESIDKLVTTLRKVARKNTRILMAQEVRETETQQKFWNYFCESIGTYFTVRTVPLEEQNEEFRSNDIILLELLPF